MSQLPYIFFLEKPQDVQPTLEVSGCVCVHKGRFLLLKRNLDKPQGGTWCLPAGKKEKEESPEETAIRELYEETGIKIESIDLNKVGSFFIQHSQGNILFHTFSLELTKEPFLNIEEKEHSEHRWTEFHEIDELNLITAGKEVLEICKPIINANLDRA